ncbi:MAG: DUF1302 family protein [Nitrospinota bacterium]|nr:DUF1302 family protein [Nitrospinota bacterium]
MTFSKIFAFALTAAIFSTTFFINTAFAEETETAGNEDLLGGFDDDTFDGTENVSGDSKPKKKLEWLDITGQLLLSSSYNYSHKEPSTGKTDFRGLSRMRAALLLEFTTILPNEWKGFVSGSGFYDYAYQINGRDEYTQDVLDLHERESELREAFIEGSILKSVDLKLGRQIVVWGKSDNIRITDILNPLDNREPGMIDIEDLRLPVNMARANIYFGSWNLEAISILEKRFNKNPAYGSDFYYAPQKMPDDVIPSEPEYALALKGVFSGYDVSFFAAKIYDDMPHAEGSFPKITIEHSYLTMFGFGFNLASGNFLYKSEAAYFDGLEYLNAKGETKSRADILLGVEYQGFTDQVLSFEIVNKHIFDFVDSMKNMPDYAQEDSAQTAFRYSGNFLHQRLHILLLVAGFGSQSDEGGFQRFSAGYDIADALLITAGVINYDSGKQGFLQNIGNNDRSFLELKWSF